MRRVPFPEKTIAQTNRPHAYFKVIWRPHVCHIVWNTNFQVQVDTDEPFRLVIELRPDMAPKVKITKQKAMYEINTNKMLYKF